MKDFLKRLLLSKGIGYRDPHRYWDMRWRLGLEAEEASSSGSLRLMDQLNSILEQYDCCCILEIGCGMGVLRGLEGYLGLDFSTEVLKKSRLSSFIYADVATEGIPLPNKAFDCVFCSYVLLHVPDDRISFILAEMDRVAKKLIVVKEPAYVEGLKVQPHCFNHDLEKLFCGASVDVVYL